MQPAELTQQQQQHRHCQAQRHSDHVAVCTPLIHVAADSEPACHNIGKFDAGNSPVTDYRRLSTVDQTTTSSSRSELDNSSPSHVVSRRLSAPIAVVSPSRRRSNIEEPYVFSLAQAAATLNARSASVVTPDVVYTAAQDDPLQSTQLVEGEPHHKQLPPRLVFVGRPLSPERYLSDDDILAVVDDAGVQLFHSTSVSGSCGSTSAGSHQPSRWSARSFSLPVGNDDSETTKSGTPVTSSSGHVTAAAGTSGDVAAAASGAKVELLRLPRLGGLSASDDVDVPRRRHSVAASILASRQLESIAEEGAGNAASACLLQVKGSIRRHSIQEKTTTKTTDLL